MRHPTQIRAVAFWSPVRARWVTGATVPATSARTTNKAAAERQVRDLRKRGVAAFACKVEAPMPTEAPVAWMFDTLGSFEKLD